MEVGKSIYGRCIKEEEGVGHGKSGSFLELVKEKI